MKKKHKKHGKHGHRNNGAGGGGGAAPARRRSARSYLRRGQPPDWKTTLAAVVGGAGSAALSGLIVNQNILSPEASAVGMIGIGGATAYFADGNTRVVGNSIASAGAGQLALALMGRKALAAQGGQASPARTMTAPAHVAPAAALSAPTPLRRDAHGGGYVGDIFRDAAIELEMLEQDGPRDADIGADVYDLDDLAAA